MMKTVIKIIDVLLISVLLYAIVSWYGASNVYYPLIGLSAAIFYVLLSEIVNANFDFYRVSLLREIIVTSILWCFVVFSAIVLLFVLKESESYSRFVILIWSLTVPFVLCAWHYLARNYISSHIMQSGNMPKAVIIGSGELAEKVKNVLVSNAWLGFNFVGNYDDRQDADPRPNGENFIGDYKVLMQDAIDAKFDVVFIALPLEAQVRIKRLIDDFGDTTVTVYIVPDFFLTDLAKGNWHEFAGLSVIGVFDSPFRGLSRWVKRVEDIVVGSFILALIAVPMLVIGLAVRFTSKGPAIFRQKRYGMDGKEISILKFRSMRVMDESDNIKQATVGDSRITPLGLFLRKSSLDELPQFLNVIAGSMSIVGPRPHAVSHNEEYRKHIRGYMVRHKVKPGITGWAQINGWRGETDTIYKMQKRIEHDLWYLENWSLWLDIKTIFLTIFKGFTGKNAY
jgi:putative colanic acid biosynthesis UDP-glucose lipid carrier transferase